MPDKLHKHAWAHWSTWIDECAKDPNHIVVLGPNDRPPTLIANIGVFRATASQWAKAKGARAHVNVSKNYLVVRIQFCWREDYHQRIHIDGSTLNAEELERWAPWPASR